ncbi:helix-turn-helix transcriptional regulator [Faecalibacillus faecis]|jgi:transcriptional regulator with XRE-family HTH domain|uniref:helix-turn-helix domain-containing protein n=1 Tax=Faecalibacillus faecis TaxID=1982628 RepID=UPI002F9213DA
MNTEYLKTLFTQRKQTRYKFCKLTGFSSGALTDILNKKVKDPRNSTIVKIAKALDLNEQEFAELCGYKVNRQSCIPLEIKDENDIHYGGNPLLGEWITGTCPRCKKDVQLGMNYCSNCGQKLLWENLENEKS